MINVSGFKVFPNEVEDVAMRNPGVLEAAVIGVPDARTGAGGEALRRQARSGARQRRTDANFCMTRLAGYKMPTVIEFVDELAEEQYRQNFAQGCMKTARFRARASSSLQGNAAMSQLDDLLRDLVVANRILSHEDVVDAYGHISVRHPDNPKRFFMSRSRAPELVERHDLIEFDLQGEPVRTSASPISSVSSMPRFSRRGPT